MMRLVEFCQKHQTYRPAGERCAQCGQEASAASQVADRLDVLWEALYRNSLRCDRNHDALMVLEARIADLEARLLCDAARQR